MHLVQPIADLDTGTELGSTRSGVVHQGFTDTTTWDEIIRILAEEALRKFAKALSDRVPKSVFSREGRHAQRTSNFDG